MGVISEGASLIHREKPDSSSKLPSGTQFASKGLLHVPEAFLGSKTGKENGGRGGTIFQGPI